MELLGRPDTSQKLLRRAILAAGLVNAWHLNTPEMAAKLACELDLAIERITKAEIERTAKPGPGLP